jgi:hypothetical protein
MVVVYRINGSQHTSANGFNLWVCTGFSSIWVNESVGLVLVGLTPILNGFSSGWVDKENHTGMVG